MDHCSISHSTFTFIIILDWTPNSFSQFKTNKRGHDFFFILVVQYYDVNALNILTSF